MLTETDRRWLISVKEEAERLADHLDPQRKFRHENDPALRALDGIARNANTLLHLPD